MENQAMQTEPVTGPVAYVQRLQQAINQHDLDAMTDCFEPDYASTFPVHPDRIVGGHARMRQTWAQIFAAVPDIQATLVRCCADGETAWAEWEWQGTRRDGGRFLQRGVTIQGVRQERIAWVRMYMEPVQEAGPGAAAALRQDLGGGSTR